MSFGEREPRSYDVTWEPEDSNIPLPLAKMRWRGLTWYRASAAGTSGAVHGRSFWTKKWDREHEDVLRGRARTVTLTNTAMREYKVPLQLVAVSHLEFHAVGNRRRVWNSIKKIRAVGKKISQGYGVVSSVEVERLDIPVERFSLDYMSKDGAPARNVPVEWAVEQGMRVRGQIAAPIQPPYWRIKDTHTVSVAV